MNCESAYRNNWYTHRVTVEGWDGGTWQSRDKPSGLNATICRLLHEMDGGSMWASDLSRVTNDAPRAIARMRRLGLVQEVRHSANKGSLLCADTDEARAFMAKYDNGQGWLW